MADLLARLNACLNLTSACFLILGLRAIRRGQRERHKRCMLSACVASALFLISYLTRIVLQGTHRLAAEGTLRAVYLVILTSHMILATFVLPLVITTLTLALRSRFDRHRRWARVTFPVWMYVSITGVVVYFMVYHYPGHR